MYSIIALNLLLLSIAVTADVDPILSYQPGTDMSSYLAIDLDMDSMAAGASAYNYSMATKWYEEGGNSIKTSGSIRTIQKFSTEAAKMTDEPFFALYSDFYQSVTYADDYVQQALTGTGLYAPSSNPLISDVSRAQGITKGAQFLNTFMYVTHEMYEALVDCNARIVGNHWDEALAFWVGTQAADSKGAMTGDLGFALAEKRAKNFGTTLNDDDDTLAQPYYISVVNTKVFDLFNEGKTNSHEFKCTAMQQNFDDLVAQMSIPFIQGYMKYIYEVSTTNSEKQRAELYLFCLALFPQVNAASPAVYAMMEKSCNIRNEDMLADSYPDLKSNMESIYPQLRVSCGDIGGLLVSSDGTEYYTGAEPCCSSDCDGIGHGLFQANPVAGAFLVVFIILFVMGGVFGGYYYYKVSKGEWGQAKHMTFEDETTSVMETGKV